MSLHIDLFAENERSNPSGKIFHTTLITVAIAIFLGLGLYVLQTFLVLQVSQGSLNRIREANDGLKRGEGQALRLIAEIAEARACLTEMTAFSNAQIQVSGGDETYRVAALLEALAWSVKPDIQLTQLSIDNSLVAGGAKKNLPARLVKGTITGRTAKDGHEDRIRSTIASLRDTGGLFGTITAGGVQVDNAKPTEIIFGINFELEPLLYKQDAEGRPK